MSMADINKIVNSRIRSATRGEAFAPPSYPMTLCLQPWNMVTVRLLKTLPATGVYITVNDLYEAAAKQVGAYISSTPDTMCPLEFKVIKIMAWNLKTDGFIRMLPLDFTTTTRYDPKASSEWKSELANVDGRPAKNAYAGVGYTWPNSFQNLVLFQNSSDKVKDERSLVYIDGTTSSDIEVHFHIHWRGMGSVDIQKVFVSVPTGSSKRHRAPREPESNAPCEHETTSDEEFSVLDPPANQA